MNFLTMDKIYLHIPVLLVRTSPVLKGSMSLPVRLLTLTP